ncbi:MAG: hypothetical protein A3F46_05375 [Legionellales bacterium RIFCSPHIGHO2_12_FULL_42_9]|nr:MAG: hypothetical protein A3F46_05375 [Legionellales bacterium RIFCSPHIGHO2_12_FULL_42_9]
MPINIKKYSLKALQKTINAALALDYHIHAKLNHLHGKVIQLIIAPLNTHFFITFAHNQLILLSEYSQEPDTIIRSSPLGLIKLSCLPVSKARSLFNDDIEILGDTELGLQVKMLFDDLDIDWEGHLARFTGDVIAHQIGTWVRSGAAFHKKFSASMRDNITEYLQEELHILLSKEELHDFSNNIDILSQDVARLQAQINWLMTVYEVD